MSSTMQPASPVADMPGTTVAQEIGMEASDRESFISTPDAVEAPRLAVDLQILTALQNLQSNVLPAIQQLQGQIAHVQLQLQTQQAVQTHLVAQQAAQSELIAQLQFSVQHMSQSEAFPPMQPKSLITALEEQQAMVADLATKLQRRNRPGSRTRRRARAAQAALAASCQPAATSQAAPASSEHETGEEWTMLGFGHGESVIIDAVVLESPADEFATPEGNLAHISDTETQKITGGLSGGEPNPHAGYEEVQIDVPATDAKSTLAAAKSEDQSAHVTAQTRELAQSEDEFQGTDVQGQNRTLWDNVGGVHVQWWSLPSVAGSNMLPLPKHVVFSSTVLVSAKPTEEVVQGNSVEEDAVPGRSHVHASAMGSQSVADAASAGQQIAAAVSAGELVTEASQKHLADQVVDRLHALQIYHPLGASHSSGLTPSTFRQNLRNVAGGRTRIRLQSSFKGQDDVFQYMSATDVALFLEFALSDGNAEDLHGVPLLLCAEGRLVKAFLPEISKWNDIVIVPKNETERHLLTPLPGRWYCEHLAAVQLEQRPAVWSKLNKMALIHANKDASAPSLSQCRLLTLNILVKALQPILPRTWNIKVPKVSALDWEDWVQDWIRALWKWLENEGIPLARMEHWPLIPSQQRAGGVVELHRVRPKQNLAEMLVSSTTKGLKSGHERGPLCSVPVHIRDSMAVKLCQIFQKYNVTLIWLPPWLKQQSQSYVWNMEDVITNLFFKSHCDLCEQGDLLSVWPFRQ